MIADSLSREFTLRHAGPSDAAQLAAFAARTFADTFGEQNTAEDMALYLGGTYGEAKQGEEIADAQWATILAEHQGQVAGFAQLRRGPVPAGVSGRAPLELLRFYVDLPWHGRGLARALMHAVEAEARTRGADALWLAVWEHNDRARVFYRKAGFAEVGSKEFVLGTDRQTDCVMAKPLPALERQT